MNIILALTLGFIIGSFPTAYILLKKSKGIDITQHGSGNVGAMNSFEVTNSKIIGILVLLIDAFKGWLASFLAYNLIEHDFRITIVALLFAVIGHCYSPWIKFKGGRGLATAAGGAIFISLPVLFLWILFWILFYLIKKNIHFANILATFFLIILPFIFTDLMINYSFIIPEIKFHFPIFVSTIMIVIISKHIEPLKNLLKQS
ncbi:MAG: glycerol-3-phosphate acyltransferase [Melioribacteraceae bacterium]|nr:glycerol-3-phosphate acyltransferase [Melioribacteraceae bacterium]